MFISQVYTVQILCLSGIMDEMHLAQEVIIKWNQENARSEGKLFLPVDDPQDANVVIGIVGNFIDNVKANVIEASVKIGKKVLFFFSKYQDPENTIPVESVATQEFRRKIEAKCYC